MKKVLLLVQLFIAMQSFKMCAVQLVTIDKEIDSELALQVWEQGKQETHDILHQGNQIITLEPPIETKDRSFLFMSGKQGKRLFRVTQEPEIQPGFSRFAIYRFDEDNGEIKVKDETVIGDKIGIRLKHFGAAPISAKRQISIKNILVAPKVAQLSQDVSVQPQENLVGIDVILSLDKPITAEMYDAATNKNKIHQLMTYSGDILFDNQTAQPIINFWNRSKHRNEGGLIPKSRYALVAAKLPMKKRETSEEYVVRISKILNDDRYILQKNKWTQSELDMIAADAIAYRDQYPQSRPSQAKQQLIGAQIARALQSIIDDKVSAKPANTQINLYDVRVVDQNMENDVHVDRCRKPTARCKLEHLRRRAFELSRSLLFPTLECRKICAGYLSGSTRTKQASFHHCAHWKRIFL